jgi:vacuolar-type H+-ATPase subunit I/STV1
VSALILVFMMPFPFFQMAILFVLSFVNLWYLVDSKPLQKDNVLEVFNEAFVYLCCLIMTNMIDVSTIQSTNSLRGWMLIVMASSNLFVNLIITALQSVQDIVRKTRQ